MATKADLESVAEELREIVRDVRAERDALLRDLGNERRLHQEERKREGARIATLLHLLRVQHDETTAALTVSHKMTALLTLQEKMQEGVLEISNATMDLWKKTAEREAVQKELSEILDQIPSSTTVPRPEPKKPEDSAAGGLAALFA